MSLSQRYIGTESGLARQSTPPGGGLTSVGLSMPAPFSVAGSPLTANGVLGVTLAPQVANTVWAAPDGASGAPSFRALVAGDIPSLDASKITTGVLGTARLGTGIANATTFLRGDGTWTSVPSGFADPMTTIGDLIHRNGSNVTSRLGIGSTGQVLTVVSGVPAWASVYADPMTTIGDIIHRNGSNVTTRLGIGSTGQVLTVVSGLPAWASVYSDPLTTNGDIVIRSGGTTTRLGIGTSGQILTVVSGLPAWATAASGFADPMTSIGDMIIRNGSNVTARMGIGATGQVLQVVGGVPTWTTVGATTQVIYNNGGLPSGESSFTWSTANKTLSISASNTSFTGLNVFGATRSLTALGTFNVTSGSAQGQVFLGYSGGQGNSSVLAIATSSSMAAIRAMLSTGTVNAVEDAIIIQSGLSGFSPSAGFGAAVMTRLVSGSTGTYYDAGRHAVVWSDATTATRSAYHAWSTVHLAGALTERMRLTSDGVLRVGTSAIYFGLRPGGSGTPVWTMPTADGTSGQVLSTNGAGVLSWITAGGFVDPMTTNGDIIIRSGGVATRLGIGTAGQVLTVVSGLPEWQNAASGFADPMTSIGDIIHRNASNVTSRLGVGTNGQVLTVFSGVPAWLDAYVDPMTTNGDLVYRSGGFASRLPIGTSGQVLTVVSGLPAWAAAAGFADPMTTIGDIIHRNGSNVTSRLGIGSTGQVLTVVSGVPAWASVYADPMTTIGDIVYRNGSNVTARMGIGSTGQVLTVVSGVPAWAAVYADPLTTNGDIVIRSGGTTTRLGIGTAGQYLRVSSGLPAWETVSIMSDPMTTAGDVIIRNGSNVTARLGIGTTNQVLTVVSGVPAWVTPFIDPMTTDGDIIFRNSGAPQRLGLGSSGQVLTVVGTTPVWANAYQNPMTTNGDLVTQVSGSPARIGIGSTNQVLRVVSGAPTWATPPATGSTGHVMYNASGDLAGNSNFFWDASNTRLGIGTSSPSRRLHVVGATNAGAALITGSLNTGSDTSMLTVQNTASSADNKMTFYVVSDLTGSTATLIRGSQPRGQLLNLEHSDIFSSASTSTSLVSVTTSFARNAPLIELTRGIRTADVAAYQPSIVIYASTSVDSPSGAAGLGTGIDTYLISSTGATQMASSMRTVWADATTATRTSYVSFELVNSASIGESVRILAGGRINLASASGEYRVNNTKVVGARITGWQMPTGTQTRTTFDTAAVTLPHLAERVYALINDLYGHGLIGN